ncbi:MAG: flagellar protein FlgN [Proteobacteria bacterium]|nr:flagellar protein FlgN [Pseudomonadota bacterium]
MMVKALIEHLEKEIVVYRNLVEVQQAETENLTSKDYRGLYETIGRKEHLLLKVSSMGKDRARLMESIAGEFEGKDIVNISGILEQIGGPEHDRLKECQSAVLTLVDTIKEINKVNALFVEGSIENIKKTLGLLGNFMPKSVYKPTGDFYSSTLKGANLSEGA